MNIAYLAQALTFLGVDPTRYYVQGVAPEQMHSEGWYALETRPGVWDGGYYERNLRDPFVSSVTEDAVVRWMLARLTDSAGDLSTGELVWGPSTVDWAARRVAATTAAMREVGTADSRATGRVSLSPGYLLDGVDPELLVAVGAGDAQARRLVLVLEPLLATARVQAAGPSAADVVVSFRPEGARRRTVDTLMQAGILAPVALRSPDQERT